jgi:arsenate reductase
MNRKELLPSLNPILRKLEGIIVPDDRRAYLKPLIDYIAYKDGQKVKLNFICTHNSRRSQLAQLWSEVAAYYYGFDVDSYSGGTEVTAFYPSAIDSLKRFGFDVSVEGEGNPVYSIGYANKRVLKCFSKRYDHEGNPDTNFAAIITCSNANENCPLIEGADVRIPLEYRDPKEFDGTDLEIEMYDNRSLQIASEMFYVFKTP